MKLVDVHCHLSHKEFDTDLDEVISRAKKEGVKAIVCSGVNPADNIRVLEIAKKYDMVHASLGAYPIDLLGLVLKNMGLPRQAEPINLDEQFEFFKKNKKDIISIGEVGLDYKFGSKHKDKQKENFKKILDFTEKFKKPLVIHSRNAEQDVIDVLETSSIKKSNVVLHCFEGNKKLIPSSKSTN